MRVLVVPLLAAGLLLGSYSDEPTTRQMRGAFERSLVAQVNEALTFIAETGGIDAVKRIRSAGNDRFELRAFRKIECRPTRDGAVYDCTFAVEIELAKGAVRGTFKGRFYRAADGLTFTPDA